MALSTSQEQFADVWPPRAGSTIAVTLDAVAHSYDISALTMAGAVPATDATQRASQHSEVFLCLQAETAGAYFSLSSVAKTVDGAAAVAAGGALAFNDAYCGKLEAGGAIVRVRIDRGVDNFLNVKGTAAGTLRLWVASGRT